MLNKNINGREIMKHLPFNGTDLNTINIDDASGNFVAGFTNDVTEGTFPNKNWQNIVQFDTCHFRSQFSVTSDGRGGHPKPAIRSWWGSIWSDWYSLVTNSDFTRTNLTVDTVANKAVEIPNAPNVPEYLPIIWSVSNTVEHQSTITYNLGKWYVYSNVSQNITIRFHKIP